MRRRKVLHRGIDYKRTKVEYPDHTNREKVFADEWEKENIARPGLNYGMGILQDLMVIDKSPSLPPYRKLKVPFWITKRDAAITATVIQWLGSNVGFSFLTVCLRKCGYEIRRMKGCE